MIQVSIHYPQQEGGTFDLEYYCNQHIPMTEEKLAPALKGISIQSGLNGGTADLPAPFVAVCHLLFDSVEAFQAAFMPNAEVLQGDIPNYTNIKPLIQISEVKISR
ncbi:MAG: EthD family reductase [Acidobacteria bacterium]|nr:EthD family reductase [Acidobacteriota bacterium]